MKRQNANSLDSITWSELGKQNIQAIIPWKVTHTREWYARERTVLKSPPRLCRSLTQMESLLASYCGTRGGAWGISPQGRKNIIFELKRPFYVRVSLWTCGPPTQLKIWIHHCVRPYLVPLSCRGDWTTRWIDCEQSLIFLIFRGL